MSWKVILLMAPLLMAAVAPPARCGADTRTGDQMPVPLDISGRPLPRTGLASSVFAVIATPDSTAVCANPLPSSRQAGTLQSPAGDALHGLPSPELLRPPMAQTGN